MTFYDSASGSIECLGNHQLHELQGPGRAIEAVLVGAAAGDLADTVVATIVEQAGLPFGGLLCVLRSRGLIRPRARSLSTQASRDPDEDSHAHT